MYKGRTRLGGPRPEQHKADAGAARVLTVDGRSLERALRAVVRLA